MSRPVAPALCLLVLFSRPLPGSAQVPLDVPLPAGARTRLGTPEQHHTNLVAAVAFAPGGTLLATGGWDGTVRLWQAQTGKLLRVLAGHRGDVAGVAFAPDGKT